MSITHASLFFLVAGSKTIVSIGQACLTVDATVLAVNALSQYHQTAITESKETQLFNLLFQATATTFSVLVIMATRYPAIWDKLKWDELSRQTVKFQLSMQNTSRSIKIPLIVIGVFGFLSCISRGMSAYLGVEVLLGERAQLNPIIVALVGWIAGVTVMVSAMCFNLSNMLTSAQRYLKKPSISCRVSIIFSLIATLSYAVAMRFFIMHFLKRRDASASEQFLGQSIFSLSEFVLGCFTMVSSFEPDWQKNAKKILGHSLLLTPILIGDSLTTWLGYLTITWYSIFSDSFLANDALEHRDETDFTLRLAFMSTACFIGIPATLSYIHYLLDYAKAGYDRAIGLLPQSYQHYRFDFFRPSAQFGWLHNLTPREQDPLHFSR